MNMLAMNMCHHMIQKRGKACYILSQNNLDDYAMSKFLPKGGFKWIDPSNFDLNKYRSNSSRSCVFRS